MNDILKARLEAIDADCESASKLELDTLLEAASHDNNNTKNARRLRRPSRQSGSSSLPEKKMNLSMKSPGP